MLKGGYKESIQLQDHPEGPVPIPIFDDDADAMAAFYNAAHFQTHCIPSDPSTEFMNNFAILWLHNWIQQCSCVENVTNFSIDDLCRLLAFAYIFSCEDAFAQIAWLLLLHHEGPFQGLKAQVAILLGYPQLNDDVLTQLDIKRQECCEMIHQGLIAPLSWQWKTFHHQGCWKAARIVGQYLTHVGQFLTYDLQFSQQKFNDIMEKIPAMPNISANSISCGHPRCACNSELGKGVFEDLKAAVSKIARKSKCFLCLRCVKVGDTGDSEETTCKILGRPCLINKGVHSDVEKLKRL